VRIIHSSLLLEFRINRKRTLQISGEFFLTHIFAIMLQFLSDIILESENVYRMNMIQLKKFIWQTSVVTMFPSSVELLSGF
jgi:hypothetical protein